MKLLYTSRFVHELKNVSDANAKAEIGEILSAMKSASRLDDIPNIKKMKGARNAFRAKAGEYRIGFFLEKNELTLARCVLRKDIYRSFP